MTIPINNNVYGTFICNHSLDNLADSLKYRMKLNDDQIWIKKSALDGTQTLKIKASSFEFESTKTKNYDEYFFNGAVAGTNDQVIELVRELHKYLQQAGYKAKFEVYDEQFGFVEAVG